MGTDTTQFLPPNPETGLRQGPSYIDPEPHLQALSEAREKRDRALGDLRADRDHSETWKADRQNEVLAAYRLDVDGAVAAMERRFAVFEEGIQAQEQTRQERSTNERLVYESSRANALATLQLTMTAKDPMELVGELEAAVERQDDGAIDAYLAALPVVLKKAGPGRGSFEAGYRLAAISREVAEGRLTDAQRKARENRAALDKARGNWNTRKFFFDSAK